MGTQKIQNRISELIHFSYVDDERRRINVFIMLNFLMAIVALVMTYVNLRTKEYELMIVTGVFALLCMGNCACVRMLKKNKDIVFAFFSFEVVVLMVYFILGGIPQGFSAMWTLLIPSLSMFVFGKKRGVRLSWLMLGIVVFFFWTPLGRSVLYYDYFSTFMLRFPFVYICLFAASYYIEIVRLGAYKAMNDMEQNATYLYRHDALTGLFTRHAFSEELQKIFEEGAPEKTSVVIFDIDDFKVINDKFGHNAGDALLQMVARTIQANICQDCVACRWGGEEFLVLVRGEHDAHEMAQRTCRIVHETLTVLEGKEIGITLSAGVAVAKNLQPDQLSDFINCADKAMYISKGEGKNRTTLVQYS